MRERGRARQWQERKKPKFHFNLLDENFNENRRVEIKQKKIYESKKSCINNLDQNFKMERIEGKTTKRQNQRTRKRHLSPESTASYGKWKQEVDTKIPKKCI